MSDTDSEHTDSEHSERTDRAFGVSMTFSREEQRQQEEEEEEHWTRAPAEDTAVHRDCLQNSTAVDRSFLMLLSMMISPKKKDEKSVRKKKVKGIALREG